MGNAESQPVRNVDKRTARRDHAPKFISAISGYRYEHGLLGADAGVRHGGGRHTQHVPLVLLNAPLQVAVRDEHVLLEPLAGERAQAVAVAEHRVDGRPLV